MVKYSCENCQKTFTQKGHLEDHQNRKRPCKKDDTIEALVEKKVREVFSKTTDESVKIENTETTIVQSHQPEYLTKTREELIALCKEKKIKGYSGKKKEQILGLIQDKEPGQAKITENKVDITAKTNLDLLEECLKKVSIKEVANKLNLSVGTIRRWIIQQQRNLCCFFQTTPSDLKHAT
jgi:transposase